MFRQIEDFRFSHRYQTRSEATVELIRLGLASLEKEDTLPDSQDTSKQGRI